MANHRQELTRRCWSRGDWDCEDTIAEWDVVLAAQQLMQLSDEENGNSNSSICRKKKKQQERGGLGPQQTMSPGAVVTSSLVVEGFCGGDEGIHWLKKPRRRYREIADIYDATATKRVKCLPTKEAVAI